MIEYLKTTLAKVRFGRLAAFAAAGYVLLVLATPGLAQAVVPRADPTPSGANSAHLIEANIYKIFNHCEQVTPANARQAICENKPNGASDSDAIKHVANIASQKCKSRSGNSDFVACVVDKANGYLDAAVKQAKADAKKAKHPVRAKDINNALDKVLKKAGGDINKRQDQPGTQQACSTDPNSICCYNGACGDPAATATGNCDRQGCNLVQKYVNPGIKMLSAAFGVIAAASIIMGGIQYSTSQGDSGKVTAAKKRIFNTLAAVLAYMFLFGFLQFLVPGGIF